MPLFTYQSLFNRVTYGWWILQSQISSSSGSKQQFVFSVSWVEYTLFLFNQLRLHYGNGFALVSDLLNMAPVPDFTITRKYCKQASWLAMCCPCRTGPALGTLCQPCQLCVGPWQNAWWSTIRRPCLALQRFSKTREHHNGKHFHYWWYKFILTNIS